MSIFTVESPHQQDQQKQDQQKIEIMENDYLRIVRQAEPLNLFCAMIYTM